jgi:regulator of protease activity HflC (stomatin/prohibitin superfamily)
MRKHIGMVVLAVAVVAVLLATTVAYQVDEMQDVVVIKTFMKISDVKDPRVNRDDAGLKFKWFWPIQQVVRYDGRYHVLENANQELQTADKQNILLTIYCTWRIDDPRTFNTSVETVKEAQSRLRQRMQDYQSLASQYRMSEYVNVDASQMRIDKLESAMLARLQVDARQYGISVRSVGVKVLGLTENVSQAVIAAVREEREKEAARYKTAGEADATRIKERAKEASALITSFAKRKADDIRSEGYAAVADHYSQMNANEQLSMFLRSLESLKKELQSRSVIILDGSQVPAVKWFQNGPTLQTVGPPAGGAATQPAAGK